MESGEQKAKVYYDAACTMCQVSADILSNSPAAHSYELLDVHTAELPPGLTREQMLEEIYVTLPNGTTYTNADAVLHLLNAYWYMRPFVYIGRLPGCIHILRALYRCVARNRYLFGHSTKV
jgi:predicted DCC family thiol-disulfide oxidoreductase YuxK